MLDKILITLALTFTLAPTASAEMLLFVGEECPHCQELKAYLEQHDLYSQNDIKELEIYHNKANRDLYLKTSQSLNYTAGGVPLLVDGIKYVEGNNPIREYLAQRPQEELTKFHLSTEDQEELKDILDSQASPKIPAILFGLIIAGTFMLSIKKR